jgi:hypothetical protein
MSNTTLLLTTNSTIERFSSKTKISKTHSWNGTACLEWVASCFDYGYGQFWLDGKMRLAHRVAMILAGNDPGELCALHRCDNPPCVNTEHLFTGTIADNNMDRDAKGRHVALRGDNNGSRTKPECLARGLKNGNAKQLTPENIATKARIFALRASGMSQQEIACEVKFSRGNIISILNGNTWAHVPVQSRD